MYSSTGRSYILNIWQGTLATLNTSEISQDLIHSSFSKRAYFIIILSALETLFVHLHVQISGISNNFDCSVFGKNIFLGFFFPDTVHGPLVSDF